MKNNFFEYILEIKEWQNIYLFFSIILFFWCFIFKIIIPKTINFFKKIINSKRYDILGLIILVLLFIIYNFLVFSYSKIIKYFWENLEILNNNFDFINWLLIISLFILLLIIFCFEKLYNKKENNIYWILISDKAIKREKDEEWKLLDKLWINQRAKDFAQTVWNNWNKDSFIFWLIAPWWHWKTSFLNLFEEELKIEKYKNKYELFRFEPWYFDTEKNLLEKFLNWISSQLSKKYFLPKLDSDIKKLTKFLWETSNWIFKTKFSFWKKENLEEIKKNINSSLQDLDKKLIIIIDDLDRVSSDKLKVIFKILDLCKNFYNTSYILCYDPNNFNNIDSELKEIKTHNILENDNNSSISTETIDNQNLVKYIGKIINIQYPIYPDYEKLKKYFIELFTENKNLNFSDNSKKWIEKWIEELYSLENFRIWWEYISDIRSMKRILNNLLALNSVITKEKNFIYNLFDEESWWLIFSNFLKLSILSLNFNHLYLDIFNKCELNHWGNINFNKNESDAIIYHWIDNIKFDEYIKKFNILEIKVLKSSILREEVLLNNINWYIDILWVNKKAWYNRFILDKTHQYKRNKNEIWKIFNEIFSEYWYKWIDSFLNDIAFNRVPNIDTRNFYDERQEDAFDLVDYILGNFFNYDWKGIDYTLWLQMVYLLDISVWLYDNNHQKISKIWKYFFEDWKVIERLINEKWWILWLVIALYLNWDFSDSFQFNEWIKNEPNKIKENIFNKFKEIYIDWWKNIFKESIDKNEWIFTIYQLASKLWKKEELQDYFFNFCFKWEEWMKYFLKYLVTSKQIKISERRDNQYFLNIDLFNIFDSSYLKDFINKNDSIIIKIAKSFWNEKIKINTYYVDNIYKKKTYSDFWEIFKENFWLD